jgi:hypothetical protein
MMYELSFIGSAAGVSVWLFDNFADRADDRGGGSTIPVFFYDAKAGWRL